MASTTETGHAVNIGNFKQLIDVCSWFTAIYNPANTAISVSGMTASWTTVNNAHMAYLTGLQNAKNPINEREILFEPLSILVTRTLNFFRSSGASLQVIQDAKGIADKIRGHGVLIKRLPR